MQPLVAAADRQVVALELVDRAVEPAAARASYLGQVEAAQHLELLDAVEVRGDSHVLDDRAHLPRDEEEELIPVVEVI